MHLHASKLTYAKFYFHVSQVIKTHFFTGALLRAEQKIPGSEYRHVIEENNVNGTIVPTTITCSLSMREMKKYEKNNFLIDGFPRNEENLTGWNEAIGNEVNLKFVLNLDCSQETCAGKE